MPAASEEHTTVLGIDITVQDNQIRVVNKQGVVCDGTETNRFEMKVHSTERIYVF